MAAATNPTVTVQPLFSEVKSGTTGYIKSLQIIHCRANFATAKDTINLATYVPGLTGVVGILYRTVDGAAGTAGFTFSTTTLTESAGATGVLEFGVIAY